MQVLNIIILGIKKVKNMPGKYGKYMNYPTRISLSLFVLIVSLACSSEMYESELEQKSDLKFTYCTEKDRQKDKKTIYGNGGIVCAKDLLKHESGDLLRIEYKTINVESTDPYERGYQVLRRYSKNKKIDEIRLRREEDACWMETPFVRIRKEKYFSDLDGDGYDEFAIFPFSSGSAIFGTVRIFSLRDKIILWGEGRYLVEGDGNVLLNCPRCSKFNLDICKKCE
ncbi:MAG: FG-GAP repeat protein [Bacteriovoracaceae bacterium]|nr:FG-GAP repeat protein [Bacteriovoracaceae bacterium]